jgi:glycosyltransferase involved in cell wall biosynthesis
VQILMAAGVSKRREGGTAAIAHNLGRELESRGHHVTYIFGDDLLTESESRGRFRDVRLAVRLARHIRKNKKKYSIVNMHAPVGFIYGILRRLSSSDDYPPYVMTLHGLEERRTHVMGREAKKGRAWHFSWKNRLWHRVYHKPLYTLAIKTADFAHCYSRDVSTILQLNYDLDSDRVAYIPNGVDERFFLVREYTERRPVRMLYPGTWLDQRGIFYIREALRRLNATFRDWTFTIAGPGVDLEEVMAFFGEELRPQISVVPLVPADRMPALYSEHDIFVFPSMLEGLPSVLLEAMASGMPAITAETCGMMDVVEDGWNGLLIPPADAAALEQALLRLCRSVDLRRQLGHAAQETMRRHSWRKSADKLERVFASALRNGRSPGEC